MKVIEPIVTKLFRILAKHGRDDGLFMDALTEWRNEAIERTRTEQVAEYIATLDSKTGVLFVNATMVNITALCEMELPSDALMTLIPVKVRNGESLNDAVAKVPQSVMWDSCVERCAQAAEEPPNQTVTVHSEEVDTAAIFRGGQKYAAKAIRALKGQS